jgi:hypothetical protein
MKKFDDKSLHNVVATIRCDKDDKIPNFMKKFVGKSLHDVVVTTKYINLLSQLLSSCAE